MDIPVVVLFVGILIFASFYLNKFFVNMKVPGALFFILVGIILGLFIDKNRCFGHVGGAFAALTLNVIIYMVGKRFDFKNIRRVPSRSLPFSLFNVIITLILVSGVARFVGDMDWISSLFLGFVVSGTSSIIIVPISYMLKLKDESRKTLIYESLITDVICLVGGLIFFEFIFHNTNGDFPLAASVSKSVLLGLFSGVVAGFLWVFVLMSMKQMKHTMFASLAFILMLFGASELLGFNGGFSVLAFGIMAGNINQRPFNKWIPKRMTENAKEHTKNEKDFFEEIITLIQTYFFVYMGMQMEYYNAWVFLIALILMVVIVFMRWVSTKMFASKGTDYKERLIVSVLIPKGIIPAVMVTFAFEMGLDGGLKIMQYGYAIIIISLLVSSILITIARKDPMYFDRIKNKVLSTGKQKEDGNKIAVE
jgi:NhaP-type Na+/H+ or K+/H+ antiporter